MFGPDSSVELLIHESPIIAYLNISHGEPTDQSAWMPQREIRGQRPGLDSVSFVRTYMRPPHVGRSGIIRA